MQSTSRSWPDVVYTIFGGAEFTNTEHAEKVLIKAGSETDADEMFGVGTVAEIVDWNQGRDGLLGVTTEGSEYVNQEPGYPSSLDYLSIGGGVRRELGSPGGWHGRLYVTFAYEKRTGSPGSLDYDRQRLFAGAALVR